MRVGPTIRNIAGSASVLALAVATPAMAQAPDDAEGGEDGAIVVFGMGETRQVQEISSADIIVLTPGTSPLKAIEKLPSVNFQSADPFGNYEWSTRVTIRSFNQSQLGFNFDGIPLGDMQYGNHNGLHISRIVSPENIGSVRVSQGAGSLGTQSTNNIGGTIETFSKAPDDRFGAMAAGTYGSDETKRAFVRLNMGSEGGLGGYVSYAYGSTDKYRGTGTQDQHMINAKAVLPVGDGKIDGWFSYSDRREQDYQDMSLDMLARLGYNWDNAFPDYAFAVQLADIGNNRGDTGAAISNAAAGKVYPGNVTSVDDAYYDASGLRKDLVAALGFDTPLGETGSFAIKGYYHHNEGMGLWGTPYVATPAGAALANGSGVSTGSPISTRTTEYDIQRYGVFGKLNTMLAFNDITLSGWFEHNDFNQARRFYAMKSRSEPGLDFRKYPKNPFFTQWEFDFTTKTIQYSVQDRIEFGDLTINVGWKGFKVTNQSVAIINTTFPVGKFKTEDWFQPHAGVLYNLDDNTEVFAGFTQATRAFPSVNGSIWGTTQAGFDAIKDTLKPETSETYELGLRHNTTTFNGTLGVYLVNFNDRLLGVSSGPGILGNPTVLQNVGTVRSIGFEAAGDLKLSDDVSIYASYTYTDSSYRDDVINGAGVLVAATKGKTVVDTPKHMLRGELSYDNTEAFGRIGFNYMSKRYFNYLNDRSVDARMIVDASLGYRFTEDLEFQFNVTNLFDEQYIGTLNSNGFGNSGDNQTLLVGAPRQAFVTLKAGF